MSVGLSGVALGVVAAHALAVVYVVVMTSRRLGVTPSAIIPGKELVQILAVSVVIAITVFPLTWWIESKIITVFIVGLAYVVIFAPAAMVFKVVSDGDLAILRRWISLIRMRLPLLRASG